MQYRSANRRTLSEALWSVIQKNINPRYKDHTASSEVIVDAFMRYID